MHSSLPTDGRMAILARYRRLRHKIIRALVPRSAVVMMFGHKGQPNRRPARSPPAIEANLNLKPGEWVKVRPEDEILSTLDAHGKYKGLYFMPEMKKFCGRRFRVHKVVKRMLLESTGEMRELKSPGIYLEGVFCDGKFHDRCDRYCFLLWKEAWLTRVEGPGN